MLPYATLVVPQRAWAEGANQASLENESLRRTCHERRRTFRDERGRGLVVTRPRMESSAMPSAYRSWGT